MRRGFKAWSERTAATYREALGLRLADRFDPDRLAEHLGLEIWGPEDVPELSPEKLRQLTVHDSDSWSAVTLHVGDKPLIIINSAHARTRRRSSLTHEMAHLILRHGPGRIDVSKDGHLLLNSFDREQEEEADWFAGALLVPRDGLRSVFHSTKDPGELAKHFEVSVDLLQWRLRMTGVAVQSRRARQMLVTQR